MNTDEKLEMVKDVVVAGFKADKSQEDICRDVLAENYEGIGFGEIFALVKNLGETEGFIVDQAKCRKLAEAEIRKGILDDFGSWQDVVEYATQITKDFNIDSPSWALNKIKGIAKSEEIELPEKIEATEWQIAAIAAYERFGADITIEQLTEAIDGKIKNPKGYARLVFPIIRELLK